MFRGPAEHDRPCVGAIRPGSYPGTAVWRADHQVVDAPVLHQARVQGVQREPETAGLLRWRHFRRPEPSDLRAVLGAPGRDALAGRGGEEDLLAAVRRPVGELHRPQVRGDPPVRAPGDHCQRGPRRRVRRDVHQQHAPRPELNDQRLWHGREREGDKNPVVWRAFRPAAFSVAAHHGGPAPESAKPRLGGDRDVRVPVQGDYRRVSADVTGHRRGPPAPVPTSSTLRPGGRSSSSSTDAVRPITVDMDVIAPPDRDPAGRPTKGSPSC